MKTYIVIPAYNEEKKIAHVIRDLRSHNYSDIIVVDDGSTDKTFGIAKKEKAIVIHHLMNMGYGGASITGMEYAFRHGADIAVAFDADGQHDVSDIDKVIRPIIKREADIVIGSRTSNINNMPWVRRIGNKGLTFLTLLMFGVRTVDSQSGFRAIYKDAWHKMHLKSNGFEYASEMIKEIGRNNIKFKEVPIHVIYSEYSMSKGQSILGGFKTFFGMLKRRLLN
jgi:glycosyltransferase involved in cell wall biosynthesis